MHIYILYFIKRILFNGEGERCEGLMNQVIVVIDSD